MATRPKKQCPVHGLVQVNRFHIIPKSKGGKLGSNVVDDFCYECHRLYHQLFSTKTPNEIIELLDEFYRSLGIKLPSYLLWRLNQYYWGNQYTDEIQTFLDVQLMRDMD